MAAITVYKNGTPMQINDFDLQYYTSKGWTQTNAPAPAPAPTTTTAPKTTTTAPAPTTSTSTTTRTLSSTEKQQLDAAYARIQAGTGSATDKQNVDYAKSKGLWTPAAGAAASPAAPAPSPTPAPTATDSGSGVKTPKPTTTTAPNPMDPNTIIQTLTSMGVDPNVISQLSPQQIQALGGMNLVVDTNAATDKNTVPPSLSAADMKSFMDQATKEIDPYYQDILKQASADLTHNVAVITGDQQYIDQQQQIQIQQEQDASDAAAAEAGLAQSGIRKDAEAKMQTLQKGAVESGRRSLQDKIYGLGTDFERKFGSAALGKAGLAPVGMAGYPTLGVGAGSAGYKPTGVGLGTVGAQQKTDLTQRQQELAGQNLSSQYFQKYGVLPSNLATPRPNPADYPSLI